MFFSNDRDQMREYFFETWRKHNAGAPLDPVQTLIAAVITEHPEYHRLLANQQQSQQRDYLPENGDGNPFLHMGMHIAISEQLSSQRPEGIIDIYQTLVRQTGSAHEAEHRMMECLAEAIWQAQRDGKPPDETAYRDALNKLAKR